MIQTEKINTVQTWSMFTVKDATHIVPALDAQLQNLLKTRDNRLEPVSHTVTYDSDKKEFVVVVNYKTTPDLTTIINKYS
jgi:hypothetical protein